jgi:hypothetical protein
MAAMTELLTPCWAIKTMSFVVGRPKTPLVRMWEMMIESLTPLLVMLITSETDTGRRAPLVDGTDG